MLKQNLLDRAVMAIAPERGLARIRARAVAQVITAEAAYDGAGKGRGNLWSRGSDTSSNAEVRQALTLLRGRHRELSRNNGYVSAAIDATVSLTIGDGIQPVARGTDPAKVALAQELMLEWSQSVQCDADGRLALFGLQSLMMRTESESGEGLALRVVRPRLPGVRVPLQIRILEGDYLDHLRDGTVAGQRVVQGVAFDARNDRAGYYLHSNHPGDGSSVLGGSKLIPASDVTHIYEVARPGQVRGVPRGAAVMTRVANIDKFQDARTRQQMVAACLAVFVTQGEDGKAKGDVLPTHIEPALIARLGQDETVTYANPPSVSGQGDFITGEEHVIAKAYGLNHQILTGNISGANFSSSKIGRLDVYGNVARWRNTMIVPQFCKRIEHWFLDAAELAGFDLKGVSFDWTPPRSEILNLRDDIPALIKQARGGFGSLFGLLRSLGYSDPKALLLEIKECNDFLDANGIVLDSDPRKTTYGGQLQGGGVVEPEPDPGPPPPGPEPIEQ
jgi:lambda family phage portal protein